MCQINFKRQWKKITDDDIRFDPSYLTEKAFPDENLQDDSQYTRNSTTKQQNEEMTEGSQSQMTEGSQSQREEKFISKGSEGGNIMKRKVSKVDDKDLAAYRALERAAAATPGPGKYTIKRWPFVRKLNRNKYPFNSRSKRKISQGTSIDKDIPGCATYNVRPPWKQEFGPSPLLASFGGKQVLKPAFEMRCGEILLEKCVGCGNVPKQIEYWISYRFGTMCNECYKKDLKKYNIFNKIELETFKPARHCSFMHQHFGKRTHLIKPEKELKRFMRKEAYFARFCAGETATERYSSMIQPLPATEPEDVSEFIDIIDGSKKKLRKLTTKEIKAWKLRKENLIERQRFKQSKHQTHKQNKYYRKETESEEEYHSQEEREDNEFLIIVPTKFEIGEPPYRDELDGLAITKEPPGRRTPPIWKEDLIETSHLLGTCEIEIEEKIEKIVEDKEVERRTTLAEQMASDYSIEGIGGGGGGGGKEGEEERRTVAKRKTVAKQKWDYDDYGFEDKGGEEEEEEEAVEEEEIEEIQELKRDRFSKCELTRLVKMSGELPEIKPKRIEVDLHKTIPPLLNRKIQKKEHHPINEKHLPWFLREKNYEKMESTLENYQLIKKDEHLMKAGEEYDKVYVEDEEKEKKKGKAKAEERMERYKTIKNYLIYQGRKGELDKVPSDPEISALVTLYRMYDGECPLEVEKSGDESNVKDEEKPIEKKVRPFVNDKQATFNVIIDDDENMMKIEDYVKTLVNPNPKLYTDEEYNALVIHQCKWQNLKQNTNNGLTNKVLKWWRHIDKQKLPSTSFKQSLFKMEKKISDPKKYHEVNWKYLEKKEKLEQYRHYNLTKKFQNILDKYTKKPYVLAADAPSRRVKCISEPRKWAYYSNT